MIAGFAKGEDAATEPCPSKGSTNGTKWQNMK